MDPRTVAILIFDDVEVLDFCGPYEVFTVTGRVHSEKAFHVCTVAEEDQPVTACGGLNVNPDCTFSSCPQPGILVVPGGSGTRREMENPTLIEWIRDASRKADLTLSVCTGALLLARTGILRGLVATTHHGALQHLRELAPDADVVSDQRVVDNGRIVLSAGISAGIDASLHIVARLLGMEVALKTARQMEYEWGPQS
jgi:transcriptional regulator GlxA family with amidase domain